MTCRFELEFKGEPYPRSCPMCGISGKCHKDYMQLRLPPGHPDGNYVVLDKQGFTADGKRMRVKLAVSQETLDGVAEAEGLIGHSAEHNTLAEAPKPHPFMAPPKPDNVGIKLSRLQRAKLMDLIERIAKDNDEGTISTIVECIVHILNET